MSAISELSRGAGALGTALGRLDRPGIRRWVAVPLLLNLGVLGAAGWFLLTRVASWVDALADRWPELMAWLSWAIWLLAVLGLVAGGMVLASLLASVLASPFNGALAAAAARERGHQVPAGAGAGVLAALAGSLHRLLRLAAIGFAVLLLMLVVPGGILVGPFLWWAAAAWMLAEEFAEPALELRGLAPRAQRRLLRQHRACALGLGSAALAATLVPGLNLLVMPAAVIAAVDLWPPGDGPAQVPEQRS